jgi:dTDP-4-dehydrorhamnose reductase
MRVLVTGARGQIGAAIVQEFQARHEVTPLDRAALDLTRPEAVAAEVARWRPDLIVNCAAYNDVDAAEDDPIGALQVNALAVRSLSRGAAAVNATLVHYGSDFVFDGEAQRPYTEDDVPNPRSVYAASKLLGDWFALDGARAYVLRVEGLFGRAKEGRPARGSVEGILTALCEGRSQKVFQDRTVSPTHVIDAACATRELVERQAPPGLYHCVNSGSCTWLEFAREAARLMGVEGRLEPVRLSEMKLKAQRPLYCALSNAKLAAAGIAMPTWQDALRRYLADRS